MKKKVLFVGSFLSKSKAGHVGGQMFACSTLIESKISNKVDWILLDSTADSNVSNPLFKRTIKAFKRLFIFFGYLIFRKIDIVLIFSADGFSFIEKGLMSVVAKVLKKRVILCPRSGFIVNDVRSPFFRRYIAFVLGKVDVVVCQGNSWKRFYRDVCKVNENKLVAVQNWIDIEPYLLLGNEKQKMSIDILFMSWVDENKGIFDLIEAMRLIKNQISNLTVHIAGNGKAWEEANRLVVNYKLDNIFVFHNWVKGEAKMSLLDKSQIYILPSYFEGFPNSLMEAMAAKCAVIATDVGSVTDVVKDNENGIIIKPKNPKMIGDALLRLINDVSFRERISDNGRETIINNNRSEVAIDKFFNILTN